VVEFRLLGPVELRARGDDPVDLGPTGSERYWRRCWSTPAGWCPPTRSSTGSGQAGTWHSLGYSHEQLGAHARAVTCYRRAIDLHRRLGDRYREAETLDRLAGALLAGGDRAAARLAWEQALDILDDLAHPDADRVRTRLAGSGGISR